MSALALSLSWLFAAQAAHAEPPPKPEPASIMLVSPDPGAEDVAERRREAVSRVKRLLGPGAKSRKVKLEGGRSAEIYEAGDWDASVPASRRAALMREAQDIWPGKVTARGGTSPRRDNRRHVNPKKASTQVASHVSAAMLGDTPSLAFDGSRALPAAAALVSGELRDAPSSAYTPASALANRAGTAASIARTGSIPPAPSVPRRADGTADTRPYAGLISRVSSEAGLSDPSLVHALIAATGGYGARRRSGGSYGLMMVTRDAANWVGVKGDLKDPETNVRAGAMVFAKLLKMFDGDVNRAAAAYKVGARAVIRSGGIPNDSDAKGFVAAFQKAYRGTSLPKPPVAAVTAPAMPNVRQAAQEAHAELGGTPEAPRRHFSNARQWKDIIARASATFGVDPALVESILVSESEGKSSNVSSAGAVGLMQLMPETARALGVKNSFNPEQNVMGGTRYLKELLNRFHGDPVLAVAAYNAGPNRAALRAGHVPAIHETVQYVTRVFTRYQQLTGKSVDYLDHMTGRSRAWAIREAHRMAKLMGVTVPEDAAEPISLPAAGTPMPNAPAVRAGTNGGTANLPDYQTPASQGPAAVPAGPVSAEIDVDPRRGRSVGQPWNGSLKDGQRLPPQGTGYHSIRESRGRFYGTGRLVAGVEWVGEQFHAANPSDPGISMGDLSAKKGGPVSGHRSHQAGVDADFVLLWKDAQGNPVPSEEFVHLSPSKPSTYNGKEIYFDTARNWKMVSLIATNPYFKPTMAFLDQPLIDALLRYAQSTGVDKATVSKVSRMLEAWPHHSDHVHVRIE